MLNALLLMTLSGLGSSSAFAESNHSHELARFVQFETLAMRDWRKENLDVTATSGCAAPKTYLNCVTDYLAMYPAKTAPGFSAALELFVTAAARDKAAPQCDKPCKKRNAIPLTDAVLNYIRGYRVTKMAVVGWADKYRKLPGGLLRRMSEERAVAETIFRMQAKLDKSLSKIKDADAERARADVQALKLRPIFAGGVLADSKVTASVIADDEKALRAADPTVATDPTLLENVTALRAQLKK